MMQENIISNIITSYAKHSMDDTQKHADSIPNTF